MPWARRIAQPMSRKSNPHQRAPNGGERPGAGRKRGDGPSKRKTSSKYVRPIPDRRELKRRADAQLREVEVSRRLDLINKVLQRRRRNTHQKPNPKYRPRLPSWPDRLPD
jgi:hypothetical protein